MLHHAEKFGVDRKYEQLKLPTKLVTTCKRPKDLRLSFTTFYNQYPKHFRVMRFVTYAAIAERFTYSILPSLTSKTANIAAIFIKTNKFTAIGILVES